MSIALKVSHLTSLSLGFYLYCWTFKKSQKLMFCVNWHKFIQIRQTLLRFEYPINLCSESWLTTQSSLKLEPPISRVDYDWKGYVAQQSLKKNKLIVLKSLKCKNPTSSLQLSILSKMVKILQNLAQSQHW